MEIILAVVIGVLGGSGVWLVLRARSYQVLMGLSLLSYAVNLFIFSMGSLSIDEEPIVVEGLAASLENYTDPLPQSLVLTAIVIGFATSALFLVVLLALRGLSGTDHVDGAEPALPALPPEANAGPASAFFQTYETRVEDKAEPKAAAEPAATQAPPAERAAEDAAEEVALAAPPVIVLDSTLASAGAAPETTPETPKEQSQKQAENAGDAPDTAIIIAEVRTP